MGYKHGTACSSSWHLQNHEACIAVMQAQDRCHRIGQTREVHIYRLVSESTIEENILHKSDQKRQLDHLAIQLGGFNTDFLQKFNPRELLGIQGEISYQCMRFWRLWKQICMAKTSHGTFKAVCWGHHLSWQTYLINLLIIHIQLPFCSSGLSDHW